MACNCSTKKGKKYTKSTFSKVKRRRAPITRAPKVSRIKSSLTETTVDFTGVCGGTYQLVKVAGGSQPLLKAISNVGSCPFTLVADDGRNIIRFSEITLNPGENLALYRVPFRTANLSFRCSGRGGSCRLRMTPC